jgi:DNA-binding LytR/AlgR family response regulator
MNRENSRILFECVEGKVTIRPSEILYIEAYDHKNTIHTRNQKYHIYESINSLETRLKDEGFIRVHRSYIVNIDHIRKINNYMMTLDSNVELPISKAKYKDIKRLILPQ